MFALASIDGYGPEVAKEASDGDRWAFAIVFPGRLVVPCGDGSLIEQIGSPVRRWRLLVGDAGAAEPLVAPWRGDSSARVHAQTFMTLDPDRVPPVHELPDPGLRRATMADLSTLGRLAVQLHLDDEFGPDPGRSGLRAYTSRIREGIERGTVWCTGPVGEPTGKLERSVASRAWGVQFAGIVVTPAHRGRKLGQAMVAAAVRTALRDPLLDRPAVTLHVRSANAPAIAAYHAAGFRVSEEWRLAVRS